MPLYEYQCLGCKKTLEVLQKISDPVKKKCPKCGGRLKKLISESAFQLKGTGWYKTDYAAKPAKQEESKPADKKEEKAEAKETGVEKKSEAPKEPEKKPAAPKSASHKS